MNNISLEARVVNWKIRSSEMSGKMIVCVDLCTARKAEIANSTQYFSKNYEFKSLDEAVKFVKEELGVK